MDKLAFKNLKIAEKLSSKVRIAIQHPGPTDLAMRLFSSLLFSFSLIFVELSLKLLTTFILGLVKQTF